MGAPSGLDGCVCVCVLLLGDGLCYYGPWSIENAPMEGLAMNW